MGELLGTRFFLCKLFILVLVSITFSSCLPTKSKVTVDFKKNSIRDPLSITVSHIKVVNNQIIITGTNLNTVGNLKIKEGATHTALQIDSKSNTSIVANTISNVTFAVGKVFDFILSNAHGASTFTVDFSLCDASLGGKTIACLVAPTDKQVLSYDLNSNSWRPRSVNGLSYKGVWSSLPALPGVGALVPGDYYIVSVANGAYSVGDWIVLNDDGVTFEQIENSAEVKTVFGRNADVVATENDYQLDLLGDVDLTTTPPILGDALIYNGTKWIAGAVSGGGGGGGAPTGAAAGDLAGTYPNPTIGNNKITNTHIANDAISQTKINGLVTTLSGKEPTITGAATTTYFRGDKTFVTLDTSVVPEGSNLYFTNARALGILLAGFDNSLTGQVSAGDSMLQGFGRLQNQINSLDSNGSNYLVKNGADTISGTVSVTNVITATGAGDIVVNSVPLTITSAVNKTYADGKLDKTTGGAVAGVVTLDNDLKIKSGSNYVTIKGNAATAGDYNFILPTSAGTSGYFLSTDGNGNTSWVSAAGAPTGAATGDLGGSYPAPTVATVGGVTAANVASGANLANAATNANTVSTIVKRDASGNFTAGTITATLNGTATNVSGTVAVANGGTGKTTLGLNNLLLGNTTSAIGEVASTATPSVLLSTVATGVPVWTTSTAGNVLKGSGSGVVFGPLGLSDLPSGTLSGLGTTNYIPYYSAASTLADSPVAVSGTNIGIGTATPGSKLEVAGQIKITGGTPGVGKVLTSDASGLASWATAGSGADNLGNHTATANLILGTHYLSGDGDNEGVVVNASGNVGIGTSNPTALVQVGSAAVGFPGAQAQRFTTSFTGNAVYLNDSTGTSILTVGTPASSDDDFGISIAGGVPLIVKAAGNVGIGISNPGAKLEVAGQIKITGGTPGVGKVLTSDAAGLASWVTVGGFSGTANRAVATNGSGALTTVATTDTELGYVSGVTSNIQTQLNAKQASGNYVTALTGDVTATGPGSVAATVTTVGGVTAANVAAGANLANAATNLNTVNTIVKRDASGNFSAGTITATLNGTATNVSGTVAVANGGTGATTAAGARTNLGLGTAAVANTGSSINQLPLLGANATVGSMCTFDLTLGFICNTTIPTGNASTANPLSQFAATTSAQLAGVLSDETGSGLAVFNTTPTFITNLTAPLIIGGTGTTSTLTYKTTSGVGAAGADHIFQVGNNGATEAMRILNNGNVGIGTSTPGTKLEVAGQIKITGGAPGAGKVLTSDAAGLASWATVGGFSGTANRAVATNGSGALTTVATTDTELGYVSGVTSNIQTQLNAKQASGNYVTALTGDVTATGPGSVAATVATVGGVTAANVAAGANLANAATSLNTASTIVKRDSSGNFSAGTITANLNGTATSVSGVVAIANGGTGTTTAAGARSNLGLGTAALANTGSSINQLPVLGANATVGSMCTFDLTLGFICNTAIPNGNASTANPLSQFAATTSAQLAGVLSNETGSGLAVFNTTPTFITNLTAPLIIGGTGTTSTLTYRTTSGVGAAGADHIFQVGNNGATEAMRILNNGNVGIGTATPGNILHVNGSQFYPLKLQNTSSGVGVEFTEVNSTGGTESIYTTANQMRFSTTGVDRLSISSAGNVGIGTNSPTANLEVAGTIKITGGTPGAGKVLTSDAAGLASWATVGGFSGTANRAVATDGAGALTTVATTATELGYISGVTSNIQTQLNAKQASGNYVTALTGDVTATGPGSVAATVATVGGVTAANVAAGANLANAATNLNTASTIVKRDASGNFTAGTITATLNGTATNVSGTVAVANGGTGATTAAGARTNLGLGTAAVVNTGSSINQLPLLGANATVGSMCTFDLTLGFICNTAIPNGNASTANPLSQFAATTSAQLAGVLSDETGSGLAVFNTTPTFITNLTAPLIIGGTGTTSALTYKTTSGVGAAGADHIFQVGNNGATEAMRILNNGSVGIGTTTPVNTLTISNPNSISLPQTTGSVADGVFRMVNANHALDMGLYTGGYGAWLQSRNSTNYSSNMNLFLNPNGGGVSVGKTTAGISIGSHNTANSVLAVNGNNTLSPSSYGILALSNNFYPVSSGMMIGEIRFSATESAVRDVTSIKSTTMGAGGANGLGGILSFNTKADNGLNLIERMRIDTDGNIGIGTSNPASLLHVNGDIEISNSASFKASGDVFLQSTAGNGSVGLFPNGTGSVFVGSGKFGVGTAMPSFDLSFGGGSNITRTIGMERTGSPFSTLQLVAPGIPAGTTNLEGGRLKLKSGISTGTGQSEISFWTATPGSSGTTDNTPTEKMVIKGSGNVGIGTTAPEVPLHVHSTSGFPVLLLTAPSTGATQSDGMQIGYNPVAGNGFIWNAENTYMNFGTNNTERIRITNTGNVGIGTTSPSYTLHVNGSVAGTSAYNNLSDIRFKKDIKKIDNALEKLLTLDGVFYNFKTEEFPDKNFSNRREMGVIAQKVEKVFPEAISKDQQGYRSVAYSMLMAPMIEAIKDIYQNHIVKLWEVANKNERKIASIENKNLEKDKKINALENDNLILKSDNELMKKYFCEKDPKAPFCKKK